MKRFSAALAALALAAAFGGPARAAGMSEGWEPVTVNQEQCVTAAAEAVRRVEFTMQRNATTAIGFRGDRDGVSIRCIAQRQIAVFFVFVGQGGPSDATALFNRLREAFTNAARVPGAPTPSVPPALQSGRPPAPR